MSVPIIDVIKIKNSDATWTIKLYHMHSVYSEVTFSHVAFAEELATEYFHEMTSKMHRDKAINFTGLGYGEQLLNKEVAPRTYIGLDLGMGTDESVATVVSVDEDGKMEILSSETLSSRPIPLEEKPSLGEFTLQGFDSEGQPSTPAATIESSSKEEAEEWIGRKVEDAPIIAVNGIPVEAGEAAKELYESQEQPSLQAYTDQVAAGVLPSETSEFANEMMDAVTTPDIDLGAEEVEPAQEEDASIETGDTKSVVEASKKLYEGKKGKKNK